MSNYRVDMKTLVSLILLTASSFLYSQTKSKDTSKDSEILNIGSRLELFVDDFLIDELISMRFVLHEPKDEGAVLLFDKEWEGPFCGYVTIIKNADKYQLFYRGLPKAGKDGSDAETTCYAESTDFMVKTKLRHLSNLRKL